MLSIALEAFRFNRVHTTVEFLSIKFSKKATKIDEIFTDNLTLTTLCQINGEDFVNFSGLLRKHELYVNQLILALVSGEIWVLT